MRDKSCKCNLYSLNVHISNKASKNYKCVTNLKGKKKIPKLNNSWHIHLPLILHKREKLQIIWELKILSIVEFFWLLISTRKLHSFFQLNSFKKFPSVVVMPRREKCDDPFRDRISYRTLKRSYQEENIFYKCLKVGLKVKCLRID